MGVDYVGVEEAIVGLFLPTDVDPPTNKQDFLGHTARAGLYVHTEGVVILVKASWACVWGVWDWNKL